jgi:hypothetical protein
MLNIKPSMYLNCIVIKISVVPHRERKTGCMHLELDMQCTYNVTLRGVREPLLPWKNKYYTFICVCVCVRAHACVSSGAWGCACACVHVALLIQHVTRMPHIVKLFVAPLYLPYFSTLFHKRHDFRKIVIEYKMCLLIFSTAFV